MKVIFVKDSDKTTVVFAEGSFAHDEKDSESERSDDTVIGYDHGTGCCPIP